MMIKYRVIRAKTILQRRIILFGYNSIILSISDDRGWIRIFGFGITWIDKSNPVPFSERIGKTKNISLFGKRFRKLGK